MERSRFRVITKGVGSHVIVDRNTGETIGAYADGQKAWMQARNLNSRVHGDQTKVAKLKG